MGGKPSCSWAAPAAALRKRQRPPWLTLPRVNREGGSGGLLCRGVGAPWHILSELGGREAEISKQYSGFFALYVMTRSSTTAAGRTAVSLSGEKVITQVHCILCWQTFPPRSPQTWYNRVPYKDPAQPDHRYGPRGLSVESITVKTLC